MMQAFLTTAGAIVVSLAFLVVPIFWHPLWPRMRKYRITENGSGRNLRLDC